MEEPGKLVRRLNDLSVANGISLTASQQALAVEMHLTALNAKSEQDSELIAEFDRVFSAEPPDAVRWAFRIWRQESPFFPTISDIAALVRSWHKTIQESQENERRLQEKLRTEAARARGELVEFSDLKDLLRKAAAGANRPVPRIDDLAKPMSAAGPERSSSTPELSSERRAELRRRLDEELVRRGRNR